MPKIAEDDVKRSGKGSKMEPEGVPKVDKIDEKMMSEKGRKTLKKIVPGAEALRRTNRVKNIIRATQPTDYLNGRSNSFLSAVAAFVGRVETMRKGINAYSVFGYWQPRQTSPSFNIKQ